MSKSTIALLKLDDRIAQLMPPRDRKSDDDLGDQQRLRIRGAQLLKAAARIEPDDRARIPAYLNNLERLGLVWFSREPIEDPVAYQVLEAQPEVLEAMHSVSRAKTVQRSIHVTPFGEDFCRVCLPLDTAEVETLAGDPER